MSWLVRCWEEPRELAQENPVYRFFVRDLRTGEEHYLNDPREVGELMLRHLQVEQRETLVGESGAELAELRQNA